MSKKSIVILFYAIFVICGAFSLVYVPNALEYSYGSIFALLIISLPLFYVLYSKFGIRTFLKLIISLSLFGLLIEYIGLTTGWPYGEFSYTANLGGKIFGILPWTIGLSWTPLVVGAVALVYSTTQNKLLRIILPALVLVLFDLLLDPLAVRLGMWSYPAGGAYYGVPIQNFFGWLVSGIAGSLISFAILQKYSVDKIRHLGYSFFISIVMWSLVSLGFGFKVPFIFGMLLTVLAVVVYCRNHEKVS